MARMLPDYIDQEDPRRNGERMVFQWLSDSHIPGTAYYSLLQKNHKHKLIGEVDFLYVCDRGFLCIEVKGGQNIYRSGMEWYSVNKKGVHNSIHNPFVQAKDCQYALKNYFTDTYGKWSEQSKYLIGYAVVFPECIFTGSGNDLVTEVMFDGRYDLNEFPNYLNKVFDYWDKLEIDRHGYTPKRLTAEQLRQANDLLRGDFQVVPSMHLELQHVDQQMLKLTEEQYDRLDDVEMNKRAIIQGGAGTGKTILALELARKYAASNKCVLYLCYNSNMAEYAQASLNGRPNITVSTFHGLIMHLLGDPSLYKNTPKELGRRFLECTPLVTQRFDVVIIDEGQDLFCSEVFEAIDAFISDGLKNGNWAIFLDPNQNIFSPIEDFEFTLEYIQELYHPAILQLKTNCRNTQPIASRTAALTIIPPAKNLKLSGPKVVTKTYGNRSDFVSLFRKELQSLLSFGVSPEDVVVLSRRKKNNGLLEKIEDICNLKIVERTDIRSFGSRCLNYYTVQSFKGLESKIVFYVDVDGFSTPNDRMLNYVAMSRARLHLYLFYDEALKQDYQDTLDKGIDLLA